MTWEEELKSTWYLWDKQGGDNGVYTTCGEEIVDFISSLLKKQREALPEMWTKLNGYHKYEISNTGLVRNISTRKLISKCANDRGYFYVNLYDTGKREIKSVSRLVAEHFIPNPDNLPTINHIDGNKKNNNWLNLEWVSYSENMQHAYDNGLKPTKLSPEIARVIRSDYNDGGISVMQLSKIHSVCTSTIYEILRNEIYKIEPKGEIK